MCQGEVPDRVQPYAKETDAACGTVKEVELLIADSGQHWMSSAWMVCQPERRTYGRSDYSSLPER
jgi:hypothetical protein